MEEKDEGSFGAGFCLGILLGLIGVVIALCIGKPSTNKGALTGWLIEAVIGIIIMVCVLCSK